MTASPSQLDAYRIRRKVFKVFGASFHVYDPAGRVVGFSKQKAFRLKEDIRVFQDESQATEILTIKARQIVDFSACYDVLDPQTSTKVGAARRKGFTSILRDAWEILDAEDRLLGRLLEDSGGMALVRRFLTNLIPQKFHVSTEDGVQQASFSQRFNPFVYNLDVTVAPDATMDRRLILAVAVLMAAIEGRQG